MAVSAGAADPSGWPGAGQLPVYFLQEKLPILQPVTVSPQRGQSLGRFQKVHGSEHQEGMREGAQSRQDSRWT